jgi:AraC-like DNA-binding protein
MLRQPGKRAEFEKITTAGSSCFRYRVIRGARFAAPYHYHPEIELTWITHSTGHRFVGDNVESFSSGDLVLLGSNLPHVWLNASECKKASAVVIQFLPSFLGDLFFETPEMQSIRRLFSSAARGWAPSAACRKKVWPWIESLGAKIGPERLLTLLQILTTLASDRSGRLLCSPRYAPQIDREGEQKINAVYRYLARHFRETVFQTDVARSIGLSAPAFSRFFRRATGRGFAETLTDVRLGHACELLRATDHTVAEICYASGFENLANFNRQFRQRQGMPPREWRKTFTFSRGIDSRK